MTGQRSNRVNILLDHEHATRLHRIAERTHLHPGTVARSLLSTALDQADPDATSVTELLNGIPGAYERALAGAADVREGRVIPLEKL